MMTSANSNNSPSETLPFIILFFSAMVGHELALESLATTYQRFPHMATSITLFQFGFCVLLPLLLSLGCSGGDVIKSFPRTWRQLFTYVKLSTLVYGATAFATASLRYEGVTYVTKVVFKSSKLIPTMVVGMIMDKRKRYGLWEYTSALLLCLGAVGFCITPKTDEDEEGLDIIHGGTKTEEEAEEFIKGQVNLGGHSIGIAMLIISVCCDALVPNFQQQIMHGKSGNSTGPARSLPAKDSEDEDTDEEIELKRLINEEQSGKPPQSTQYQATNTNTGGLSSKALMVNTNSIGFTCLLLSTMFSRSFLPIVLFLTSHPHFLLLHLSVGVGLGTAVLSYTELIRRSGPAVAVAVATLRKVVTVVLSYILFPRRSIFSGDGAFFADKKSRKPCCSDNEQFS